MSALPIIRSLLISSLTIGLLLGTGCFHHRHGPDGYAYTRPAPAASYTSHSHVTYVTPAPNRDPVPKAPAHHPEQVKKPERQPKPGQGHERGRPAPQSQSKGQHVSQQGKHPDNTPPNINGQGRGDTHNQTSPRAHKPGNNTGPAHANQGRPASGKQQPEGSGQNDHGPAGQSRPEQQRR